MKYVNQRTGLALLALILSIKGAYDWNTQHIAIIALDFGIALGCLYILKCKIDDYKNRMDLLGGDEINEL